MNRFEKRLMKWEKKQLAVTVSAMLETFCNNDGERISHFLDRMEKHGYSKQLKVESWLLRILSFCISLIILFCIFNGLFK